MQLYGLWSSDFTYSPLSCKSKVSDMGMNSIKVKILKKVTKISVFAGFSKTLHMNVQKTKGIKEKNFFLRGSKVVKKCQK